MSLVVLARPSYLLAAAGDGGDAIHIEAHAAGGSLLGDPSSSYGMGIGLGLSVGYRLRLGALAMTPQIAVDWARFGAQDVFHSGDLWSLGVLPGVLLAYEARRFRPWLGVSAGFRHTSEQAVFSANGFGFDCGAGFDFGLSDIVGVGPFVSYNLARLVSDNLQWVAFGIRGVVDFF